MNSTHVSRQHYGVAARIVCIFSPDLSSHDSSSSPSLLRQRDRRHSRWVADHTCTTTYTYENILILQYNAGTPNLPILHTTPGTVQTHTWVSYCTLSTMPRWCALAIHCKSDKWRTENRTPHLTWISAAVRSHMIICRRKIRTNVRFEIKTKKKKNNSSATQVNANHEYETKGGCSELGKLL